MMSIAVLGLLVLGVIVVVGGVVALFGGGNGGGGVVVLLSLCGAAFLALLGLGFIFFFSLRSSPATTSMPPPVPPIRETLAVSMPGAGSNLVTFRATFEGVSDAQATALQRLFADHIHAELQKLPGVTTSHSSLTSGLAGSSGELNATLTSDTGDLDMVNEAAAAMRSALVAAINDAGLAEKVIVSMTSNAHHSTMTPAPSTPVPMSVPPPPVVEAAPALSPAQ